MLFSIYRMNSTCDEILLCSEIDGTIKIVFPLYYILPTTNLLRLRCVRREMKHEKATSLIHWFPTVGPTASNHLSIMEPIGKGPPMSLVFGRGILVSPRERERASGTRLNACKFRGKPVRPNELFPPSRAMYYHYDYSYHVARS